MSDVSERGRSSEPTFKLDGEFLKREAKEALKSYFMPLSGIYAALTGRDIVFVKRDRDGKITRARKGNRGGRKRA